MFVILDFISTTIFKNPPVKMRPLTTCGPPGACTVYPAVFPQHLISQANCCLQIFDLNPFENYRRAVVMYKPLNDLAPLYLKNLFTRNSHCSSRALRNTQRDLKLPLKNTSSGQNGFSFRGAKARNGISAALRKAP